MGYTTEERARKSGSIVLASEPGVGVTLTSWGAVHRAFFRALRGEWINV